jgi:hypothetical protein
MLFPQSFIRVWFFWESRLQHKCTWWLQVLWKFRIFLKFLKFWNFEILWKFWNFELWNFYFFYFKILNFFEYDTVARADNYFAEYRMLFSRRHSNECDIFHGSCIDVIKSRLRKNLKAPASSRIMPFLKTNLDIQSFTCRFQELLTRINYSKYAHNSCTNYYLHRYETELFSKWTPHVLFQFRFVCLLAFKNGIIRLEAGAFKCLRNRLFMTSMQLPWKMSRSLLWLRENNMRYSAK